MRAEAGSAADKLQGVSETLLIPLACRARASLSGRFKNFSDPKAVAICQRFNVDLERYAGNLSTMRGVLARGLWYDFKTVEFLRRRPDAAVFSIGSGLNTMFERVQSALGPRGDWHWIDSDLADVVALRQAVFEDDARRSTVIFDAADSRLAELEALTNQRPLLVISEAVLIYLREKAVARFFSDLAAVGRGRKECGILFDWCSPELVRRSARHPALKKLKSDPVLFQSSLLRPQHIRRYHPAWKIEAASSSVIPICAGRDSLGIHSAGEC
jgi:O-methyltransferase involved in polyketide biosynthesis